MNRAAPSSNLRGKPNIWFYNSSVCVSSNPEYVLLGNKERIKEVRCDPVGIYGARSHAAEACRKKLRRFSVQVLTQVMMWLFQEYKKVKQQRLYHWEWSVSLTGQLGELWSSPDLLFSYTSCLPRPEWRQRNPDTRRRSSNPGRPGCRLWDRDREAFWFLI